MNQVNNGPNREWLARMAAIEDSSESVAVGGMASELGLAPPTELAPPEVFGKLIQFARRYRGLSIEGLAEAADVEVSEILSVEQDRETLPSPRTVGQLAQVLSLPAGPLTELAGLKEARSEVSVAALRFAASSDPSTNLTSAEREAFEEFLQILVNTSDQG